MSNDAQSADTRRFKLIPIDKLTPEQQAAVEKRIEGHPQFSAG